MNGWVKHMLMPNAAVKKVEPSPSRCNREQWGIARGQRIRNEERGKEKRQEVKTGNNVKEKSEKIQGEGKLGQTVSLAISVVRNSRTRSAENIKQSHILFSRTPNATAKNKNARPTLPTPLVRCKRVSRISCIVCHMPYTIYRDVERRIEPSRAQ